MKKTMKIILILCIFPIWYIVGSPKKFDSKPEVAVEQEVENSDTEENIDDCQSCYPIRTLCGHISSHTPDEEYEFHYRRMILEAACADPATDTDEEIYAKIRRVWKKCEDQLVCANPQFDTVHGNIIKYATAIHQNAFFDDVLRWGVNLNRVDPVDDMTVLDYVKDQMKLYKLEPGITRKLKFYYSGLRKAGAKHKSEL